MNDADSTVQRGRPWANVFLAAILGLVSLNVFLLFWYGRFSRFDGYGNLVFSLGLLFNHIAFQYPRTGWQNTMMKGVASIWLAVAAIYLLWSVAR